MTTNINVAVNSGGLPKRARQQSAANRQAKLERDNLAKVEARAMDARTAALRKALLGTDGKPLFGTSSPATARRDEPAASRQPLIEEWLLRPAATAENPAGTFSAVVKKYPPIAFGDVNKANGASQSTFLVVNGGPPVTAGSPNNALQSVCAPTASLGLSTVQEKLAVAGLPDFTFETWAKLTGEWVLQSPGPTLDAWATLFAWHRQTGSGSHFIQLEYSAQGLPSGRWEFFTLRYSRTRLVNQGADTLLAYNSSNNTMVNTRSNGFIEVASGVTTTAPTVSLNYDEWFHVALSRSDKNSKLFLNGTMLASWTEQMTEPAQGNVAVADESLSTKQSIGSVSGRIASGNNGFTSMTLLMSNTRFIRKGIYKSNFTPPERL